MTYKSLPKNSVLEGLECCYKNGQRLWKRQDGKRYFTWDGLHGEIEIFNRRGKHLGAMDPVTGRMTKDAVEGRTLDVS